MLTLPKNRLVTANTELGQHRGFARENGYGPDDFPVPEPEPLVDRHDLLYLFGKYLRVLVAILTICILFGLIYYNLKQPMYESTALIYIDPKFDEILRLEKSLGSSSSDLDSLTSLGVMIMADSMVLRVAKKLDLQNQEGCLPKAMADDPNLPDQKLVRFLQQNRFNSELALGTRLLKIIVRDPDPERAQLIASTFASEFDQFLIAQRQREARTARAALEVQIEQSKANALAAEKIMREFREAHPHFPVEQDHDMFTARLTQFSNDLNAVVSQRVELESQLESIKELDPETAPMVIVELTGYQSAEHVRDILTAHSTAAATFAAMKQEFGPSNQRYLAAESEFALRDSQLKATAAEIKLATRSRYESIKRREQGLRDQLDAAQQELVEMKSLSSEFRALQQQAERQWLVQQTLQNHLSESVVATDSVSNIATEVSEPMRPYKKAEPKLSIILVVCAGFGTFLSAAFLGAKFFTGVPYSHRSQLARLGLPVIADWENRASLPAPGDDAVFLHSLGVGQSKIIHFLSPDLPGTAGSVADAAAQMTSSGNARSLLVSVRPNPQGTTSGAPPTFSENGNLSCLKVTPQAAMQGDALESYLQQFGDQFRHIFLESSACPGDDVTRWLASLSDKNVVIVGRGTVSKHTIDSAIDHLTAPGMPPVGLIVAGPELCPIVRHEPTTPVWRQITSALSARQPARAA